MKLTGSVLALVATVLPLTANAFCNFKIVLENSLDSSVNGEVVQSLGNIATPGDVGVFNSFPITMAFASGNGPSTVQTTGIPDEGTGTLALALSPLGAYRIVFAKDLPADALSTEWTVEAGGVLLYGQDVAQFQLYSPPSSVAHYEIYWRPQGSMPMFGAIVVGLRAVCV